MEGMHCEMKSDCCSSQNGEENATALEGKTKTDSSYDYLRETQKMRIDDDACREDNKSILSKNFHDKATSELKAAVPSLSSSSFLPPPRREKDLNSKRQQKHQHMLKQLQSSLEEKSALQNVLGRAIEAAEKYNHESKTINSNSSVCLRSSDTLKKFEKTIEFASPHGEVDKYNWKQKYAFLESEINQLRKQNQEFHSQSISKQQQNLNHESLNHQLLHHVDLSNQKEQFQQKLPKESILRTQYKDIVHQQRVKINSLLLSRKEQEHRDNNLQDDLVQIDLANYELCQSIEFCRQNLEELRKQRHDLSYDEEENHQYHADTTKAATVTESENRTNSHNDKAFSKRAKEGGGGAKRTPLNDTEAHSCNQYDTNMISTHKTAIHNENMALYQVDENKTIIHGDDVETHHGVQFAKPNAIRFLGKRWLYNNSVPSKVYPARRCRYPNCKKRVRTFCKCRPGYWQCPDHISIHISSLR